MFYIKSFLSQLPHGTDCSKLQVKICQGWQKERNTMWFNASSKLVKTLRRKGKGEEITYNEVWLYDADRGGPPDHETVVNISYQSEHAEMSARANQKSNTGFV